MLGIYLAGGVSGAHLNPAISIMLALYRGFPWARCGMYVVAQFWGAFAAAAAAYGLYRNAIMHFSGALIPHQTGVGLYTQPRPFISPPTAFFNEFVATGVLSCSILALGDDSNAPPGAGMAAFIIGLLVTALCMVFGYNTGACLNPVRDFGPRLVALAAGYGPSIFTAANCWYIWGACGATITGAIVGGAAYDIFIFVGGESPINYPPKRRKRSWAKKKARVLRRFGGGRTTLMGDLEGDIQKHSD
jgi:aquaglyceroporin related protein